MTTARNYHRHGSVFVGRLMVAAACLLLLGANGLILVRAAAPPHPLPELELIAVASLLWMFTGASAMCARMAWGRGLTLTILYAGSIGFFVAAIITVTSDAGVPGALLRPIFIATAVYVYVSLVLTHSKHVRRLTSRTWE